MKIHLALIIVVILAACAGGKKVVLEPIPKRAVYFGFNEDRVLSNEQNNIDGNVGYLKKYPEKMIIVEGHTDAVGTNEYNLELGDRRARDVKHLFVMKGISPERIVVVSYGEEKLLNTRNPALNRRAVIKLTNSHFLP